jgi:hypothetical protein
MMTAAFRPCPVTSPLTRADRVEDSRITSNQASPTASLVPAGARLPAVGTALALAADGRSTPVRPRAHRHSARARGRRAGRPPGAAVAPVRLHAATAPFPPADDPHWGARGRTAGCSLGGSVCGALTGAYCAHMSATPLERAEHFVWLTARVLEQRRFAYHFRSGAADPVETALSAYRNPDDGYGHALEPDLRGPVSQPLHVAHALRVLDEIGRCGGQRAERICRYVTAVSTPEGALPALHPSVRGFPVAPWLPLVDDPPGDLRTTGPVVGTLHRNGVWHAWLFRATDFCWAAIETMDKAQPYEVAAATAFLDHAPDRPRARAAAARLGRIVREQRLVALDPARGPESAPPSGSAHERHFAYDYARTPQSPAREWFTDAEMDRALDFLEAGQQDDGGWPARRPAWAPGTLPEWRPLATIEALLTLRAYGRPT